MKRPLVAAFLTTLVIVAVTVTSVLFPWSRVVGVAAHETISGHGATQRITPTDTSLRYVALGSSYAAGPDSSGIISSRCLRTGDDYPHQVAAAWRMTLTDVTCSGSTIPDILDRAQPGRADEPQIDAVTSDTDLVTITTGGNDVQYIGRLTAISCGNFLARLGHTGSHRCRTERPGAPPTPADFAVLERRLVDVVDAVRLRAPRAVVMIVSYLPVLDSRATTCAGVPLTPAEAFATVETFRGLTDATRAAAGSTGTILVDATTAGAEHTACSTSPWVYGYRVPAPYHPNADGRAAMARLTSDAIERSGLRQLVAPK